jgi:hypothetical protein
MLECPNGGRLVEKDCILYEPSMVRPCFSTTPEPSKDVPSTPEPSKDAQPSKTPEPSRDVPSTPEPSRDAPSKTPEPSRDAEPSKTSEPSKDAEPSKTSEPSKDAEPSKPCNTFFCPDGMIPQYISTQSTPVCIYGRYDAVPVADGLDCPNGGRIVGRECILYEPAMVIPCFTQTPNPSKASEPSPTPTKPVISATITIEIRTNMTFANNATNITVLQDPQVLYNLRDAIAKTLGVSIDLIVIESIQFIKDGIVQTTANVLQGRRLAVTTGYDIKYKIVDPPQTILQTPIADLAAKMESSASLASAMVTTVQSMTGILLPPESLAVQSEMAVQIPTNPTASSDNNNGPFYFMIGGICVAVGLVSVGAMLIWKKQKRSRIVESAQRMEPVTIINPMPTEPAFFPAPRYFNQSVRDVVFHKPQQVRRV